MKAIIKGNITDAKLWLPIEEVEDTALIQIQNTANLPWVEHLAIMPDCHAGVGVTIGSVVATKGAVAPNIVGVDIGCGCVAVRTNLTLNDLPKNLAPLRERIESLVPHGTGKQHETPSADISFLSFGNDIAEEIRVSLNNCDITDKGSVDKALCQLGTLGSGNHFIEVSVDLEDRIWIMLHSGSRNFGLRIAECHAKKAELLPWNIGLPDPSLSVFLDDGAGFSEYWNGMQVAQKYAKLNRNLMIHSVLKALDLENLSITHVDEGVNCHHNYATKEIHFGEELIVARKGAISARKGELGIIPGAMGRKSFIVEGLGNAESLSSASHGAGRCMSRSKAKKTFSVEDLKESTKGVECHVGKGTLDEIAEAYKDIEKVMECQSDLVKPIHELRALLCVKGHDEKKKF